MKISHTRAIHWTFLLIALLGPAAAMAQEDTPLRIAIVDMERIVFESRAGQDLQSRLEGFRQSAQSELTAMQERAQDLQKRASEAAATPTGAGLAELRRELEEVGAQIQRRQEDLQREMERIQTQGLQQIESQLQPVFEQFQDEMDYDVIFNRVNSAIVKASDRVEITDEIVRRYNAASRQP